jgi:TPR repeat protein
MTIAFQAFTDTRTQLPSFAFEKASPVTLSLTAARSTLLAILFAILVFGTGTTRAAVAGGSTRGTAAYSRGDYTRAIRELAPAASRGIPRAQGQLGFMYENGFGVPQNYAAAADLYRSAATQGDVFAQSRLGLSYDKGHGVPKNVILSYKWLDLAAAKGAGRERDYYRRLRDAVASKMTSDQIVEGQRLALIWATGGW